MDNTYETLAAALADDAIRCQFQLAGQFVISRQVGPIWPDAGNSFWVTSIDGHWWLFTWAPVGYQVPKAADIVALCQTCMGHGNRAMGKVPVDITKAFGLVELSEEEAQAIYHQMGFTNGDSD